jgi:hypothetical protein
VFGVLGGFGTIRRLVHVRAAAGFQA